MNKKNKNLGTMNGWDIDNPPVEYVDHLDKCGREYTYTYCLGKPGDTEQRVSRSYNVVKVNKGNCYNEHYCHDCGCTWSIDSSG